MPIPDRPTQPSVDRRWVIRTTDDASPTLVQAATHDAMHSGCGAVAETRHVYLNGSGVAQRLAQGQATRVLEVGLGSGMGWLLSADAALASAAPLFYLGLENRLPPAAVIRQLDLERYLQRRDLLQAYLDWLQDLPPQSPAAEPATARFEFETVTLELLRGDAVRWCHTQAAQFFSPTERFDAIYFDPYSPESCPRLWQQDILDVMRQLLDEQGQLVSYCVSRSVRDTLRAAGLQVSKFPGPPGGKREVLRAHRG